jgi:hypothetical protein
MYGAGDVTKLGRSELRPASPPGLADWVLRALGRAAPRARVTTSAARLGARLDVAWSVEPGGSTTQVTVSLVGSEVVRRRVSARTGISIVTERGDFFVVELDRRAPVPGTAQVTGEGAAVIPAGLVPSFAAKFNEISWTIVVEILSSGSQSSRQEFPLEVSPVRR